MRGWLFVGLVLSSLTNLNAQSQPKAPANGLKGEYFNGPNFERKVLTRIDPQVSFDWNWQMPGPGVQREYFSVRWTGKLYAPSTGRYRFSAVVDDGVRVWVNKRLVIDEWRKQDDSQFVGEIALKAGQFYDLRIEYYNDWKGSNIVVFWQQPNELRTASALPSPNQLIPSKYLFSAAPRPKPAKPTVTPTKSTSGPATTRLAAKPVNPVSRPATSGLLAKAPSFEQLKQGETVVLRNVFFAQGEYTLLPESSAELNRLVAALHDNANLQIDIAGHTDNVGDPRLNQALSENRARVVGNYLIRHGISDTRFTVKGYGGTRPLVNNANEDQRALNRRVEFVVR